VDDLKAFARLVTALRPWLGQLVVVGGWAHRLHRFHRLAKPPGHLALRTRDTDLAFSAGEVLAGDVRTALTEAGFTEEFLGDDSPPATHYRLRGESEGFSAEFLTPLQGNEMKRGRRDATMSKAGVTAQKLRYLDILLFTPWSVRVGPEREVPIAPDLDLFVPNPASFIVQKLLIHPDRSRDKRAQDVLYIHDSLELFGGSLGELRRLWLEEVRPAMPPKTARRAEAIARDLFADVTDTIRAAARIPQDRQLAPGNVQRACEYGLGEILAPRS
jgi:Nucleotidyltransferase